MDPHDHGCDVAAADFPAYVDAQLAGEDADARFPAVAAHLRSCSACRDDHRGLVGTIGDLGDPPPPARGVRIAMHHGARAGLRPLFELAEDSASELDRYLEAGRVLVALDGETVIGHLQLTETDDPSVLEIKNMAVAVSHQGRGVGRRLVQAAIELAGDEGRATLVVATAAADVGNLRFYQRLGFRMRAIERDAFTAATGYAAVEIDGIELRDRVWLDRPVVEA